MKSKKPPRTPKGWTLDDVERVRLHYENQTDEEAVAEDEAARRAQSEVAVMVPRKLVPKVRKFIAAHQAKFRSKTPNSSGATLASLR